MATDLKIAQPLQYYKQFLEQDVRPDERELGEIRPTTINLGSITSAEGSALVKMGNTTVVCGIKAEIAAPNTEEPKRGFVVPNVELSPLCSPNFRPGPPSEQAQAASVFVNNVIKNSGCIDFESLCIEEGKFAWVLYCDLLCLNYDGNILDACCIALLGALRNAWLPKVSMSEETGLPVTDLHAKLPLQIKSQPVATTLAVLDQNVLITDPTEEEEELSNGKITIVTLDSDQLCLQLETGCVGLKDETLQKCFDRAATRGKEIRNLIEEIVLGVER